MTGTGEALVGGRGHLTLEEVLRLTRAFLNPNAAVHNSDEEVLSALLRDALHDRDCKLCHIFMNAALSTVKRKENASDEEVAAWLRAIRDGGEDNTT